MSKFRVKDKVRVKKWEEMEIDFEKSITGIISPSGLTFHETMSRFCGKKYEISKILVDENGATRYLLKGINANYGMLYSFDDYMLDFLEFGIDNITDEMIVELRDGRIYLSLGENFVRKEGYIKKSDYDKNLKSLIDSSWDIVAAYPPSRAYGKGFTSMLEPNSEPIWEEKRTIEISEPERTILKNLDDKYKWIARDKDGTLYAYSKKPKRLAIYWSTQESKTYVSLDGFSKYFNFVCWKDKEPLNFRDLLKGE